MRVSTIMKRDVVVIASGAVITHAAKLMLEYDIGCLLVSDNGRVSGILTDRDITMKITALGKDPEMTTVKDIMIRDLIWITPETEVLDATHLMAENEVRRLPVMEDGRLCGFVSAMDLARTVETEVGNLLSKRPISVHH